MNTKELEEKASEIIKWITEDYVGENGLVYAFKPFII